MPSFWFRQVRRSAAICGGLCILAATASAQQSSPSPNGPVTVGPWKIDSVVRDSKFVLCSMTRTTQEGVEVNLIRDAKGFELEMSSPKWKLGHGKSYPVDLAAGSFILQAAVSATGDAISVRLADDRFVNALSQANELDVKGAGATIKVALDRSADGLDRLDACYKKNATSGVETNPFVAPNHKP